MARGGQRHELGEVHLAALGYGIRKIGHLVLNQGDVFGFDPERSVRPDQSFIQPAGTDPCFALEVFVTHCFRENAELPGFFQDVFGRQGIDADP